MNPSIKKDLLNPLKKQNNILNLIDKTYIVYSPEQKDGKVKYIELKINLNDLNIDLLNLKKTNDTIFSYLNDSIFR